MEYINAYFKDLIFTKVVDNKEGYAIYGAGISSGIGGGKMRYVLLFVPVEESYRKRGKIEELRWKNLQTRALGDSYKLKPQRWNIPRDVPDFLLSVQTRSKNYSTYTNPEIPFEILLLHNPRKKTEYQYRNKLMLSAAIDMFETIINYKQPEVRYPFVPPPSQITYHSTPDTSLHHYHSRHDILSPEDYSFELV